MAEASNNSYRAVNPYDFIPFENEPTRAKYKDYYPDATVLQSGWLEVQIKATTPLILPDGSRYKEEELKGPDGTTKRDWRGEPLTHKTYSFFKLPGGEYAIPESSLRGMLRSLYEAATNSCLPLLPAEPDRPISQRTPLFAAFHKRGLLEYNCDKKVWRLWRAKAYLNEVTRADVEHGYYLQNGKEHHNADPVWFVPANEDNAKASTHFVLVSEETEGAREGVLQFSIPVDPDQNYHVAVLERQGQQCVREWKQEEATQKKRSNDHPKDSAHDSLNGSVHDSVENIKKELRRKRDNAAGVLIPQEHLLNRLERIKYVGGMVPVYYFKVDRGGKALYYLSGSAAGRVQQRRTWDEIVGEYGPCKKLDDLCPACALFGTKEGLKGRLRFTEAVQTTDYKPYLRTLPILGEPKPSAFEFYLRKPEDPPGEKVTYWNFDFYSTKKPLEPQDEDSQDPPKTKTEYYDLAAATPRGRKMYWHSTPANVDHAKSNLNSTMEIMPQKATFKTWIYFDRITEQQLQDLIWIITLGDNTDESKLQQKLGHAKPLGYGSVKLTVTGGKRRVLQKDFTMRTVPVEVPKSPQPYSGGAKAAYRIDPGSLPVRSLLKMCSIDAVGDAPVHYLYQNATDSKGRVTPQIYEWFSQNRKNADTLLTLPEPLDADLRLPSVPPPQVGSQIGGAKSSQRSGGSQNGNADFRKKTTSSAQAPRQHTENPSFADKDVAPFQGQRMKGRVTEIRNNGCIVNANGKKHFIYFKNIPGCSFDRIGDCVSLNDDVEIEFLGYINNKPNNRLVK